MTFDIAAAVAAARPGETVVIPAGDYPAVQLHTGCGGAPGAPVTVMGKGVRIRGLKGLAVHDLALSGLEFHDAVNGVQFSQSGSDFTRMCARIFIVSCVIHDCSEDGIKISQADDVRIVGNVIARCGQQCVDLLDVSTFAVTGNHCSSAGVAAAIATKGGCCKGTISANEIEDLVGKDVAAIEVGGACDVLADAATMKWTRQALAKGPQAHGVSVLRNEIRRVAGQAIRFTGAVSCSASLNRIEDLRPGAFFAMGAQPDNRGFCSAELTVKFNTLPTGVGAWGIDKRQDPVRDRLAVA